MEKRIWIAPEANEVVFAADNYCASSCGAQNTVYKFTCDAGGGTYGYVWTEATGDDWTNPTPQLNTKDEYGSPADRWTGPLTGTIYNSDCDDLIGSNYHACNVTHEASTTSSFLQGYYLAHDKWNDGNFSIADVLKVIIWRGPNNDNVHCTESLDMNTWETAKS